MPSPLDHGEPCTLYKKQSGPDGMGGEIVTWLQVDQFTALISLDNSTEAKRAEQDGIKDLYTVYVHKNFELAAGDYFKRNFDGQIFRVTSSPEEQITPNISGMNFKVFSAAKAALPE